ncbi:MAG TPA: PEGA domain-containing protein [Polyangiaceae bacterium LLY-WYZ-15_(1-7)]|nr:PEGA domain-containing protein [Polyangiaceae bacterium LLY-WYZ-15_(1-7)]HJL12270.1 PEGA domain-containing protein [Polyangiaceae bacterium LLY-WYZ-15_(1-7)]
MRAHALSAPLALRSAGGALGGAARALIALLALLSAGGAARAQEPVAREARGATESRAAEGEAAERGAAERGAAESGAAEGDADARDVATSEPAASEPAAVESAALESGAAEARALFERGRELAEARRFAEATESFEASLERVDRPSTRFNLAVCQFALGRMVEAIDALERFQAAVSPEADPEGWAEADRMLAHARAQVAELTLELEPAEASVRVDGTALEGEAVRTRRLNPGVHVLRVTAPGHAPWLDEVTLAPGEARRRGVQLEPTTRPARLEVRVDVPRAEVRVDGRPHEDGVLAPGRHRVEVAHPGRRPWARTVELGAGERLLLDVTTEPLPPPRRWPRWVGAGVAVAAALGLALGVGLAVGEGGAEPNGGTTGVVLRPGAGGELRPR